MKTWLQMLAFFLFDSGYSSNKLETYYREKIIRELAIEMLEYLSYFAL